MSGTRNSALSHFCRIPAALVALLLVVACSPSAEERLERGEQAFSNGEFRAAAIDARAVLQAEPGNVGGRVLLGKSSIRLGDVGSAEKELLRAIELGVDKSEVAVDLGQALLAQQKFQQFLDDIPADLNTSVEQASALKAMRAQAYLQLGDSSQARELYQSILSVDEHDTAAMLGVVSTYIAEGRHDQARATVDQVRSAYPEYLPALLQSASMHVATGNWDAAETEFKRADTLAASESATNDQVAALRGLTEVYLQNNRIPEAKVSLDKMVGLSPDGFGTRYLQARYAYAENDLETAKTGLQEILQVAPNFNPAKVLLGAVNLRQGNLGQADMYLSAVVAANPGDANARRLLAETKIQQNHADDATALLQPLIDGENSDPLALALVARARMSVGNFEAATSLLQNRVNADPENQTLKLDLAAAYLAAGDLVAAEELLAESLDENDPEEYRREMLHILAEIRRDDTDAAISAAKRVAERFPEDTRVRNVLGGIYLDKGDHEAALAEYRSVLAIVPGDKSALMNMARVEVLRQNFDAAAGHFTTILKADPNDTVALVGQAMLASQSGDQERAFELLQKARDTESTTTVARLMLGRLYMGRQDYAMAEKVAAEAVAIDAQSADAHTLLGMAVEAQGNSRRALDSFSKASAISINDPRYSFNYARALIRAGQAPQALKVVSDIEQRKPTDLPTLSQIAALKAGANDNTGAVVLTNDLLKRFPESDVPHVLLGEIYFKTNEPAKGAVEFEKALTKRMSLQTATRAYALRRQFGVANPEKPVKDLLAREPDNQQARLVLAQHAQTIGDDAAAANQYEALLVADPNNAIALNNLAWMKFVQGDVEAESIARRAYQQAPKNSSVLDTFGWILVSKGSLDEGIKLLREADKLSNGRPAIRYHLAVGLARSGAEVEAQTLLKDLLANNDAFAERSEAEELLQSL